MIFANKLSVIFWVVKVFIAYDIDESDFKDKNAKYGKTDVLGNKEQWIVESWRWLAVAF